MSKERFDQFVFKWGSVSDVESLMPLWMKFVKIQPGYSQSFSEDKWHKYQHSLKSQLQYSDSLIALVSPTNKVAGFGMLISEVEMQKMNVESISHLTGDQENPSATEDEKIMAANADFFFSTVLSRFPCEDRCFHMRSVFVDPTYGGRGLGHQIVQHLISRGKEFSAKQIRAISANKFMRSILLKAGFDTQCEWKITELPYADRLNKEFHQKYSDGFVRNYILKLEIE